MREASRGFTLVEVVLGLALLAVGVVVTVPLFVFAAKENAAGGDLGQVGVFAEERMEQLRAAAYGSLLSGGSLTADVDGYSDTSDPDVVVRWTVADHSNPTGKLVRVHAAATREIVGQAKQVTLSTLRTE